ncbi:9981_t:CDS:10 [Entrophospora sp. SA101]|nr:9981_t:CDS:10 [Entrophospora sp. SA101]
MTTDPYYTMTTISNLNTLPEMEILASLKEIGITCGDQELKKPSSQFVMELYEAILISLATVTKETWGKKDWCNKLDETMKMTNGTAVRNIISSVTCNKIMVASGIKDFGFNDIVRPEPKRLRGILSAIINLLRFKECKADLSKKYEDEYNNYLVANAKLTEKSSSLLAQLNNLKLCRKEQEPEVSNYQRENANLTSNMREIKRQQQSLLKEISNLKAARLELIEKINNTNYHKVTTQQIIDKLKGRIVLNPDKIKQNNEELNNNLLREKKELALYEKTFNDLQIKINMLNIITEELTACITFLDENINLLHNSDKEHKKLMDLKEEVEKRRQYVCDIQNKQQNNLEERITRQAEKHKSKVAEKEEKAAYMQKKYEYIQERRKEIEGKSLEEKSFYDEAQNNIRGLVQAWDREKAEVESAYKGMIDQIHNFEQEALQILQKFGKIHLLVYNLSCEILIKINYLTPLIGIS